MHRKIRAEMTPEGAERFMDSVVVLSPVEADPDRLPPLHKSTTDCPWCSTVLDGWVRTSYPVHLQCGYCHREWVQPADWALVHRAKSINRLTNYQADKRVSAVWALAALGLFLVGHPYLAMFCGILVIIRHMSTGTGSLQDQCRKIASLGRDDGSEA